MGLKANDFDWRDLKGKKVVDFSINTSNESTVTVECRDGTKERYRLPAVLRHMMDAYALRPPF